MRKEGFASRWSRLKREPEAEKPEAEPAEPAPGQAETSIEPPEGEKPVAEMSDDELLEKFSLPDPDTMKAGDNFSAFMNQAIPDRLRRRALRVLWGSNPILANLDELVDYGDDFTDAATVVENMQTIYQVGKGSAWKFQEEQARIAEEKAAAEAEEAERRAHNSEPEDNLAIEDTEEEEVAEEPAQEQEVAELSEESLEPTPPPLRPRPRPRAMRFEFD